ncbi:hypothetical protein GGR55DRAFT_346958 [Xylaria sp. FL0064]|nr:hypothetical protein GGR55DRAFT_346958 [Xylaria sp. FL0064]
MPRRGSLSLRSLGAALPGVESIRSRLGSSNKSQCQISQCQPYPIRLFDLPPELNAFIFDYIYFSRGLVRTIRLRRVNSQFKHFIDDSLFRIGLDKICESGWSCLFPEVTSPHHRASLSYLNSHLVRQVLREERNHILKPLGRIRHVARTLSGGEDDLMYLSSLLYLVSKERGEFPLFEKNVYPFGNPFEPMIERDVFVANAYLGRKKECIEFMSSVENPQDIPCCSRSREFEIFGNALDAATLQGNLEMIKLLISQCPKSCGNPYWAALPRILNINSAEAHQEGVDDRQAIYDFVLAKILFSSGDEIPKSDRDTILFSALYNALEPKSFERVFPLVNPEPETLQRILSINVRQGRIEMVRHLLNRGVSPNSRRGEMEGSLRAPIVEAICSGHDEILSMLLDYKANPNHHEGDRHTNALMAAVWQDRVPPVKILLDRGANLNEGHPAPLVLAVYKENIDMYQPLRKRGAKLSGGWVSPLAMEVTYLHGLSSMQDILVKDGVCKDRPGKPGHRIYPPFASGNNYFYRQRLFDDPEVEENKRRLENA